MSSSFEQQPHPILKPIPLGDIKDYVMVNGEIDAGRAAKMHQLIQDREDAISMAIGNPIEHGFRMPSWDHTFDMFEKWMEVFAFGGNGGTKSRIGAWVSVQCLLNNPGHKMYCFAQDDDASVQIQQRYIYEHLPPRFKENTKSGTGYLKYSMKNGFTDNGFILDVGDGTEPRECHFYKYSQYQANKAKFEGYEYGSREPQPFTIPEQTIELAGKTWTFPERKITLNCGGWLDEYLENGDLYNTLLYRVPRRGASLFTTFTPIDHMTAFVADKIKGSQVTKTIETSKDVFNRPNDPETVEWVREKRNSDKPKAGVGMVFMPSEHNPWAGFDNMVVLHSHKSLEERLVRFHGIPSDVITSLFPKFSTNINVVKERWKFDPKRHTCYMVADPAGRRSYTSIWALVDEKGYVQVQKEFPERDIYGEWARFGSPRWTYGPASKKVYSSTKAYVDEWTKVENELGVKVFERIGDKRAFATENDDSVDRFTGFSNHGMHFVPSGGKPEGERGEIETGLQYLDEWFEYDQSQPIDDVNRPLLTIHESCGNLIDSIMNYNALDGKKDEALKDFIDLIRYLRMANEGDGPMYMGNGAIKTTRQGKGY